MIRLHVIGKAQSDERAAAESLYALMSEFWVGIEQDPDSDVRILVDVNCPGQAVQDLDIVVLAVFAKPPEIMIPDRDKGSELGRFLLGNLCAVIEVKSHRREGVKLDGDRLCVRYGDDWHDATRQNAQQAASLKRHLEQRNLIPPYVYNFIWLRNVTGEEMAQGRSANNPLPHNLLFSDSSMGNLLTSIWTDWHAKHPNTRVLYGDQLLISSDRHTRAQADFDGISQTLTSREMTLLPVRATSVSQTGYRGDAGRVRSNASRTQYSRRRGRPSFLRLVRSLPGLLILALVVVGSSLIGFQRLVGWIRPPAVQTSQQGSADFAAFEGKYKCQSKGESYNLTINRDGDRLHASSVKGHIALIPVSKNEFRGGSNVGGFNSFSFSRNVLGKVVSLTSSGNDGQKILCQRID
ncbi:MAG: hypothetical protein QOE77_2321 [Blastocatellia bacterium]|nr:hypothetical protein [Blastocatellia bacterium]